FLPGRRGAHSNTSWGAERGPAQPSKVINLWPCAPVGSGFAALKASASRASAADVPPNGDIAAGTLGRMNVTQWHFMVNDFILFSAAKGPTLSCTDRFVKGVAQAPRKLTRHCITPHFHFEMGKGTFC